MATSTEKTRVWRAKQRAAGRCAECGGERDDTKRTKCSRCRERARAYGKASYERLRGEGEITRTSKETVSVIRAEALAAYGGTCACCGEWRPQFMTLDHINNDGKQHRQTVMGRRIAGWVFYRRMRILGYPPGLQVLCYNCNFARHHHGGCPHKTEAPLV